MAITPSTQRGEALAHGPRHGRRVFSSLLIVLGGILASSVPFLPWARGIDSQGPFANNAFELAPDVDLRLLAYLMLAVGSLGLVAGLLMLAGSNRLGIPGAVIASGLALVLSMVVVASFAFAQFLALPALHLSDAEYLSFPPALLVLGISTVLTVAGTGLSLRTHGRRRSTTDGKARVV
jgi:hypothetical protein